MNEPQTIHLISFTISWQFLKNSLNHSNILKKKTQQKPCLAFTNPCLFWLNSCFVYLFSFISFRHHHRSTTKNYSYCLIVKSMENEKKNFRWCALLLTVPHALQSSDHIQRVCRVWLCECGKCIYVQYLLSRRRVCMKSFFSFFVFILKKWVIIKHKTFSLVFTIVWTKTDMPARRLQLLM